MFKCNVGKAERIVRVIFGAAVFSLAFWGPRTPWAFAGLIFVLTGALGHCPIFTMIGVSTCARKKG
jgi:hypothetical protein